MRDILDGRNKCRRDVGDERLIDQMPRCTHEADALTEQVVSLRRTGMGISWASPLDFDHFYSVILPRYYPPLPTRWSNLKHNVVPMASAVRAQNGKLGSPFCHDLD